SRCALGVALAVLFGSAQLPRAQTSILSSPANPIVSASTYLGGSGDVFSGYDITWTTATDSNGNVYIAGDSNAPDFPVTANAVQKTYGDGGQDGFVAKFDKNGNLLWSTFLGGSGWDGVYSFAVDANGNAVVTGESDGFMRRIDITKAGSAGLIYSTYLGGATNDFCSAVVVDPSGNAFVAGETQSANFPTTLGPFQRVYARGMDAFVAKLNPA